MSRPIDLEKDQADIILWHGEGDGATGVLTIFKSSDPPGFDMHLVQHWPEKRTEDSYFCNYTKTGACVTTAIRRMKLEYKD